MKIVKAMAVKRFDLTAIGQGAEKTYEYLQILFHNLEQVMSLTMVSTQRVL